MSAIDHSSYLPLYAQVIQYLYAPIENGTLGEGEKIPSENTLAKDLGVSRITVTNAIRHMVQEGTLYRIQGKGTFVAPRKKREHHLTTLISFTEDMVSQGLKATSRIIEFSPILPPAKIAQALRLGSGERAWMIKRIRYADEDPMAIQTAYLPEKIFPGLTQEMIQGNSLYKTLINAYKIEMRDAEEKYNVILLRNEADTALLGVANESPSLFSIRISTLQDGRIFEYTESILRGDRYVLSLRIKVQ